MADKRSPGILVVDDRPDLRALLQTVLRHYGFDVWLTTFAPAAELFARHRDRIALVLLGAPADGSDVCGALRSLRVSAPQVVCCALLSDSQSATEGDLIAAGAVRVIHTPYDPAALARLLWSLTGSDDRRSKARFPRQSTRVAVAAGLQPAQIVECRVNDQSLEGLQLHSTAPLGDVGALLNIRPVDAAEDEPWVAVQVRYTRPEGDGWIAGCRYVHAEAVRARVGSTSRPAAESVPAE